MFKKLLQIAFLAGLLYVGYWFIMTVVAPAVENKGNMGTNSTEFDE